MQVVIDYAIKVIGNKAEALRWLGTPVRALHYETISRLASLDGQEEVRAVLGRLEYGVW
jgi:uncharacterized protein (DUF2384 family)